MAREPDRVARLGRAVCEGLLAGGVLPVLKHIPGHGRARVDSHYACPVVESGHQRAVAHRFRAVPRAGGDAVGDDRAYRLPGDRPGGAGDVVAAGDRRDRARRDRLRRRAGFGRSVDARARRRARRARAAGARRRLRPGAALQRRPGRDGGDRRGGTPGVAPRRRRGSPAARRCAAGSPLSTARDAERRFDALLAGAR